MSLPFEFNWGIETAIKRLYPNATFKMQGIEIVEWHEPSGLLKPSWHMICAEMEKLHAEHVQQ